MYTRYITDPSQIIHNCPLCQTQMHPIYGEGYDYDSYHCPNCQNWESPIPPHDGSTTTITHADGTITQLVYQEEDFEDFMCDLPNDNLA